MSRRERLLIGVAGAAILLLPFALPFGSGDVEPVEFAHASPVNSPAPALPVAYVPPPPPLAPAASPAGLVLRSIFAGGAIIAGPSGEQLVRTGREAARGLVLKSVGVQHVILTGGGGEFRIELGKVAATVPAPAAPPSASSDVAAQQRDTLDYRLGLQPIMANGRVGGFAVKEGARLPHLARAGIQPGDVILSVNGSRFDEERMMELSWEIANAPRTELEVVRGGRKIRLTLQPSDRL